MHPTGWCPEVRQDGMTLTVCGEVGEHTVHRLGTVEWTSRGKVRRTVDGDIVGARPRRTHPPVAPRTSASIVGGDLDSPRADVGMDHPAESHAAAGKALRGSASLRAQVLALVAARRQDGATSDEVERHTGRAHQSISATLYGLEQDGLATRTGPVRRTRYANDARAYVVTAHGLSELRRVGAAHPGEWA